MRVYWIDLRNDIHSRPMDQMRKAMARIEVDGKALGGDAALSRGMRIWMRSGLLIPMASIGQIASSKTPRNDGSKVIPAMHRSRRYGVPKKYLLVDQDKAAEFGDVFVVGNAPETFEKSAGDDGVVVVQEQGVADLEARLDWAEVAEDGPGDGGFVDDLALGD